MDILNLFIAIILFLIVYFASKLAINPLIKMIESSNELSKEEQISSLIKLRDIEILSDNEMKKAMSLYQEKYDRKSEYIQYQDHLKILYNLKNLNFFTDQEYSIVVNKLGKYFNIDK